MRVQIGINPLTWSNDDLPSVGANISLQTCLSEARQIGYAGVELGNKFPRDAAVLGPILAEHSLRLVSGWYSTNLLERDDSAEFAAMQPHFNLLKKLGCDVVVVAETTACVHSDQSARLSSRPQLAAAEWPRFGRRMTDLAKRMRDAGLRLAYHHHMGTVVQSGDDVDRLMQHAGPEAELLLDTGHLTFAGADPVRIARDYGTRVAHVHCKDVRAAVLADALNRDASFLDAVLDGVYTVPGDGCVDYAKVLGVLASAGYKGWLVVEAEQDPTIAPPVENATRGLKTLQTFARQLFN